VVDLRVDQRRDSRLRGKLSAEAQSESVPRDDDHSIFCQLVHDPGRLGDP
jgi:hypothetical protein